MCRSHGIPHQKVTALGDLAGTLQSAWGLNRHNVVEVITNRNSNVAYHRQIQAAVSAAVSHALTLSRPGWMLAGKQDYVR